jgi:hypothetical protein
LTCFCVLAFALPLTGRHSRYVTGLGRFACVRRIIFVLLDSRWLACVRRVVFVLLGSRWLACRIWLTRCRWLACWFPSRLRNVPSLRLLFVRRWFGFFLFLLRTGRDARERQTAN